MHLTDKSYAIVIPARYQSSRFPGKPLVDIAGKSMIQRVWERCIQAVEPSLVYIATDDQRIAEHCSGFTSNIELTSAECLTGTDRVAEVAKRLELDFVVNVQGDEPLLDPNSILKVIDTYIENEGSIVNAMCPIESDQEFFSVTVPKVVATPSGKLLYMSRAPIPGNKHKTFNFGWKQVCVYVFPNGAIQEFSSRQQKTPLEQEEDIEILRFIEMGYDVQMVRVSQGPIAVDTPQDRERVESIIHAQG